MKRPVLVLLIFVALISVVHASEDRYIFIIDESGNTKFMYQSVLTVPQGYYLPTFDMELYPPKNVTNLEFYDSDGKLSATYVGPDGNYSKYKVRTKKVEFNKPYGLGYECDLENYTTVRYNENYHFKYPFYLNSSSGEKVYICIPSIANEYPAAYDNSPTTSTDLTVPYRNLNVTFTPVNITPTTLTFSWNGNSLTPTRPQEVLVDICPNGYMQTQNYHFEFGKSKEITTSFKITKNNLSSTTYSTKDIDLTAPLIYKEVLERNVNQIEPTLPKIGSELELTSLPRYNLTFISDTDKVFGSEEVTYSSQQDGTVYLKVGLMRLGGDEFIQINLLRAILNSALLNTYGNPSGSNWWADGASTNMALKLMKDSNLPHQDVQKVLDENKLKFKSLSINEKKELINLNDSNRIFINSDLVDEIDNICPDHVVKLNRAAKNISGLDISEDREFNNYLIYTMAGVCSGNVSKILDSFGLEHDDVLYAKEKFDRTNDKIHPLSFNRDIIELKNAKDVLNQAKTDLEQGKVNESLSLVESLDGTYESILEIEGTYEKVDALRPKLNAIPEELRSVSILGSIQKLDEAESLLNQRRLDNASSKIKDSETLYNETIERYGTILQDYLEATSRADGISQLYPLSKILAQNELKKVPDYIKKAEFSSAKSAISSSLFWSDNAAIFSIGVYVLLAIILLVVYKKGLHKKLSHHHQAQRDSLPYREHVPNSLDGVGK